MRIPYGFKKTEYANPGAENYAFIPNMTLPAFSVGGRGSMVQNNFMVFQPRQLQTNITIPYAGLGGLSAGQIVSQPLLTRQRN